MKFRRLILGLLLCAGMFIGTGCGNLLIHHRSRTKYAIHVYINWKRACVVRPKGTCRLTFSPGVYTFYAVVPGSTALKWSDVQKPAMLVIDEHTVITLRDPISGQSRSWSNPISQLRSKATGQ